MPTGNVNKMPADVARCNGNIYANGRQPCPQRDKCLRFLSPPHEQPNQVWVVVAGDERLGDCDALLENH